MDDPNSNAPGLIVNPSPRTLFLVRHGETQGNIDDKAQGFTDAPLTELGRLQAKAVAERLSDINFTAVYSSDLQRALDTAKAITANQPELLIQTRTQLREINFGDYEDLPWAEVGNADPEFFQRWKNLGTRVDTKFPGGESMLDTWQRVGEFANEIAANHHPKNATLLLVGHGGSLQALFAQLLNLRITDQWSFSFLNTSVTVLKERPFAPSGWRAYLFNDTSHLDGLD